MKDDYYGIRCLASKKLIPCDVGNCLLFTLLIIIIISYILFINLRRERYIINYYCTFVKRE